MRIKPTAKHPDVVMMDGIVEIWLEEELLVFKMRINLLLNLLTKLNVGPVVVKVIHGLVIEASGPRKIGPPALCVRVRAGGRREPAPMVGDPHDVHPPDQVSQLQGRGPYRADGPED